MDGTNLSVVLNLSPGAYLAIAQQCHDHAPGLELYQCRYVSREGDNTYGTNWATAYTSLQKALNETRSGQSNTIYVMGETFPLLNSLTWSNSNVSILGSYAGSGLPGPLTNTPNHFYARDQPTFPNSRTSWA